MKNENKIQVNLEAIHVIILEQFADKNGITVSWLLRILIRNPLDLSIPNNLRRPKKFTTPHSRFTVCIYDDKTWLKSEVYRQGSEVSAYLRFLIGIYLPFLEDLDFVDVKSNKKVKVLRIITLGFAYANLMKPEPFANRDYWPKNREANLRIMHLGRSNRKYPRII